MTEENKEFIFFQEDDFIFLRGYRLFLNEVLHRDFIKHSIAATPEVLGAYAQELNEEADAHLTSFQSIVNDVEGVRAQVRPLVDEVLYLRQTLLKAKQNVPRYRRVGIDAVECALFDFDLPDVELCSRLKISGVVARLTDQCRDVLKIVERYSFDVNALERGTHPMFHRIVAARRQKIRIYGFSPEKPPTGSGTSVFDFRKPYRGNTDPHTLELYRLTASYARASSALFRFSYFLDSVQQLFKAMIDRLSLVTASSTFSMLLLTLDLVFALLPPLQLRMERLQEWSDFMRHRGNYAVDEE